MGRAAHRALVVGDNIAVAARAVPGPEIARHPDGGAPPASTARTSPRETRARWANRHMAFLLGYI
jgi:hypothetical protein